MQRSLMLQEMVHNREMVSSMPTWALRCCVFRKTHFAPIFLLVVEMRCVSCTGKYEAGHITAMFYA